MTLQKEDIENLLLNRKREEMSELLYIPKQGQPIRSSCAYLASFFDNYIQMNSVKPDKDGRYCFAILKRELTKYSGKVQDTYFRTILKDFGYTLRFRNKWVEVIKQYT